MERRLLKDLLILCAGLAGLTVGQLLAERVAGRRGAASAVSAGRLASTMGLATRMSRWIPQGRASSVSQGLVAFFSGIISALGIPLLSRLLQGSASKDSRG